MSNFALATKDNVDVCKKSSMFHEKSSLLKCLLLQIPLFSLQKTISLHCDFCRHRWFIYVIIPEFMYSAHVVRSNFCQ